MNLLSRYFPAQRRMRAALMLLMFLGGGLAFQMFAERVPESREVATHVFTGVVDAVFTREAGKHKEYVVRIKVERVDKGTGLTVGEFVHTLCWRKKSGSVPLPDAYGHTHIPKEGQRLKVFVRKKAGLYEGIYPDWFEEVEKGK